MSKTEILKELSRLSPQDRLDLFEHLCDLEERDLLRGVGPSAEEKAILDSELNQYSQNPEAGSSWSDVKARLQKPQNP